MRSEADPELIDALIRLFINRLDTYGLQKRDGSYARVEAPIAKEILARHLNGEVTVGAYLISPDDNTVKEIVFDVDVHVEDPLKTALEIDKVARGLFCEKSVLLEASRFPDPSYHVRVVFEPSIPAAVARFLGKRVLDLVGKPDIELFPKQDEVGEGFGNLLKLPLGLHRKAGKWSCFMDLTTLKPLPPTYLLEIVETSMLEKEIQQILAVIKKGTEAWFKREDLAEEPYRGRDPSCIVRIKKGVMTGIRNECGIRLSSYWLNFCRKDATSAWTLFKRWNARNKPSLDERELKSIFQSALRGSYTYGCDDNLLKSFCVNKENCPLSKTKKPSLEKSKGPKEVLDQFLLTQPLTEAELEKYSPKVEEKLKDPSLLLWIHDVLGTRIVGEARNRLLTFLVALSYKTEWRLALVFIAEPSTGKSWISKNVLRYFPNVIKFSRMTPKALERCRADLNNYVLYIVELAGALEWMPQLRELISEGELALLSVEKNEGKGLEIRPIKTTGTPGFCINDSQTED